ncbi:hypothetical protein F2Q69_00054639 [Brassica cretica]|uniref:PPM-type phosphatase domain-containing protein n=2 Tax=Brassica cretica TaxID=69181 RepID=A0ABQ7E5X4_BRACR|nr:hypothetical protein F2Q69_00054639 [Brassica cretica]KAF3591938.1 hypothetical protein DY000_02023703 [Brassica cretica]
MGKFCCFTSDSEVMGGQSSSRSGKGRSDEGLIKFGFSLVKGKANHPMEDYHVANFINIQDHELEFWEDPRRSILKAYEKTDQAILSNSSDLGRGGSTAVTAILINGRKLWIANVGDSRAVLYRGGKTMQMSTDHEPRAERSSIEDRGGFVSNLPGDVPRVNGQLAVSRAFGDKGLKTHLSSEPDIKHANVDSQTDILVLASDGIWKVMTNEEAMEIAKRVKDPQKAAKELTAEALRRESKDDISCVVVRFR